MTQADDTHIQGEAIAGFALALSLLIFLQEKGIMSADQQEGILDGVLSGLETKLPNHPAVQQARKLIEQI